MIAGWLRSRVTISTVSLFTSGFDTESWNGPDVPLAGSSSITWRVVSRLAKAFTETLEFS